MRSDHSALLVFGSITSLLVLISVRIFIRNLWDRWWDRREQRQIESSPIFQRFNSNFATAPSWVTIEGQENKAVEFERWLLGLYEIALDCETPDEYFQRSRSYLGLDKVSAPNFHEFLRSQQGKLWNTHAENGPDEVRAKIKAYARASFPPR